MYITMVNLILFKSAACIGLAVFVSYLVLCILSSECLSRTFLMDFSVPANTMLRGKLFQLFITLLMKNIFVLIPYFTLIRLSWFSGLRKRLFIP